MTAPKHPRTGTGYAYDILHHERRNPLDALFAPEAVAIIGASETPNSVGLALVQNLSPFPGRTYLINPKRKTILGKPAYPDIRSVPEKVDLAVIATPAVTVPGVVRDCANAGVGSIVIISAGFNESGKAGDELARLVLAEARRAKIRFIGPNCLGVMVPHGQFNATFADGMATPGQVAFLSQSGALCTAVLDWSYHENVGFSAFVSVGSMLDVGWGDLITYFGDDPKTKSIVCYMESIGDARSFLSAAREVALAKPIIVLKVGRTSAAAKAAASHTGSLTGSDEVLDAAFRRAGVLRVDHIEDLFDMAQVLAMQPRPRGPHFTIVTNAGGPGALATDVLTGSGGKLAELADTTRAALDAFLPPHWSHGNPVDILGDASAERYAKAVGLVADDPNTDGLLAILTPQAMTNAIETAEMLKPFAHHGGKPFFASWMGGPAVDAAIEILNKAGIPNFKYPDRAALAFAYMWRYSSNLQALYETPELHTTADQTQPDSARVRSILDSARQVGRTLLTEVESKQVLAAYGIPTVPTHVACTEEEAVQRAHEVGFPAVLKLYSETLTHKTDVGGVQLDLRNVTAVREAWHAIKRSVTEKAGSEHFLGVTVQPMVRRSGYELILGSSIDPQFGPVLLFGTGGQLVEVFKDRALGLPPLNGTLARRLMEQTRIYTALHGVRGRAPIDLVALERILVRFSQLVAEQPWIAEIDINPLLASSEQLLALDARVVLHGPQMRNEALPRLAIRPYPSQYITNWKLKNGDSVTIRPIRPEDEPLMIEFHHRLSERSVYFRYFGPLRIQQRIAHERLSRLCFIDYDRDMALVAERNDPVSGDSEILGVARLTKSHGAREAEFAIVVSDQWQNQGLGTHLLQLLVNTGRDEKLGRITAMILPENHEMQHLAKKAGFHLHAVQGECRAEIIL